jgi:acyl-CoA reductase-like NAD-dependent aldehyde dehydrogenase
MSLPRQTAQTNSLIAELVGATEELPLGVANTITGGHVTGDALVRSPDVPTISFTGRALRHLPRRVLPARHRPGHLHL